LAWKEKAQEEKVGLWPGSAAHAETRWIDHGVAICRAAQWRMGRVLFLNRRRHYLRQKASERLVSDKSPATVLQIS